MFLFSLSLSFLSSTFFLFFLFFLFTYNRPISRSIRSSFRYLHRGSTCFTPPKFSAREQLLIRVIFFKRSISKKKIIEFGPSITSSTTKLFIHLFSLSASFFLSLKKISLDKKKLPTFCIINRNCLLKSAT